jgi:hypothetical protein
MKKAQELEGVDLLDALGVETEEPETGGFTPRQERILAGLEDIVRFYESHGHAPQHGQHLDIFERLYAVRLDQLRKLPEEDLAILRPLDRFNLLTGPKESIEHADSLSEDELLAALSEGMTDDIGTLVHVQSPDVKRETETSSYIAEREKCEDFDLYKPLFEAVQADLASGRRSAKAFEKDASIEQGDFFILDGQLVYVAAVGETFKTENADTQGRLRAIYSNGTESNILLRSLQRALYEKHRNGRRITAPDLGPLFGNRFEEGDIETGTIYVLRSLSQQPEIAAIRTSLHKIGVTGGSVEDRIANAKADPTYLYASVEIVATWTLANIHRLKLEQTIHRVFSAAQLQMSLPGYPGRSVEPREWFVVPLPVIDEVVQKIQDGTITEFVYDPSLAKLKLY